MPSGTRLLFHHCHPQNVGNHVVTNWTLVLVVRKYDLNQLYFALALNCSSAMNQSLVFVHVSARDSFV